MGNAEFSEFDSLFDVQPNYLYDSLIHSYIYSAGIDISKIVPSPWTARALGTTYNSSAGTMETPQVLQKKRRYKPVHRKVRPVATNMPNPEAQQFKPIPVANPIQLPFHPVDYKSLNFGNRVTLERLELMLSKIEPGILTPDELNLLAFVVVSHEKAFAFEYAEKGMFSRDYYPDYEIPTVEHVPWQRPPIEIPQAIVQQVRQEIVSQENAGRFEPTTSSYRSAMFVVAKKNGVRIVINLEPLNAVTIQDASLLPNVNEFAEWFLGYSMYGLYDLFSGFDARWVAVSSRPLQAFHSPVGPRQQATLVQGYTNSVQEFQRATKHTLKSVSDIADNFIDDCGVVGPRSRYDDQPIPKNPNIRRFVWEYIQNVDRVLAALIQGGITASGTKAVLAALRL